MSKYTFYYDESEHSRKINYDTINSNNYYDNFVTMIVGWSDEEANILQRYATFENKYADRKDHNGEIKSTMLKQKQFKYGFASLNKQNAQVVNDFLSLFDKDTHIYFSVSSKIEYLVLQIFRTYRNGFLFPKIWNWLCKWNWLNFRQNIQVDLWLPLTSALAAITPSRASVWLMTTGSMQLMKF